jgi:hypothetical protein
MQNVTIRLPDWLHRSLIAMAKQEERSLANLVRLVLSDFIRNGDGVPADDGQAR